MPFLLDGNPTSSEISDAVNYLLSNFGPNISSDPNTGQITATSGQIIGYVYKYMAIKYADSFDGTVNFSDSPTGRTYFGLRNSDSATESTNPADYLWQQATGGFGTTKFIWYQTTGGRAINFVVSTTAPDTGWSKDLGASIDLDVVTSGNIPVIAESFVSYFTPGVMQVPRSGSPLTPSFTGITPTLYAVDQGIVIPYSGATTDTDVAFVNSSWRIGNSSTTGLGDISLTNITIGSPTDAGDYAVWPTPTAMSASPAYITVPIRYKNSLGTVSQASVARLQLVFADPGANGLQGVGIDISGYTSFVQNAGGAYTPSTGTLSALLTNVTSPTYSWAISGATPTSSTSSSVVVTPTSSSTGVTVTLTVNGSNLLAPISKTISMPVVYDGVAGTAGANGIMSAFPSIYIWTGSSTPPTRPSTTSTYTWSTGSFTAPSGWSSTAPSNTTAGNYLWSITYPLNVTATTTTSTLDWTDTANAIRSIAYNGANGTSGTSGSATFVVTRTANDSSAPTNAEVTAVIGRNPVAGDIVTVSYNSALNAIVYRYTTSWITQATYLTGSLIVDGTITGSKVSASTITASNIAANTITASKIAAATITSTEIAASTITASNMVAGTITAASGILGNASVDTLQIAGNAVIVPSASTGSGTGGCSVTLSLTAGNTVYISGYIGSVGGINGSRTSVLKVGSTTLASLTIQSVLDTIGNADFFPTNLSVNYTVPSTGSYTFSISYSGSATVGTAASALQVLGIKR
jgi:hypothetical protein